MCAQDLEQLLVQNLIKINRTMFQICENCLKQGLQNHGQTGRELGLLV